MLKFNRLHRFLIAICLVWLSLLGLLSLFVIMFYQQNNKASRLQLLQEEQYLADEVDKVSTQIIHLANNAAMQFYFSPGLAPLRQEAPLKNSELIESMRELNSFVSASDYIDSIYLVNHAHEAIYSNLDFFRQIDKFQDSQAILDLVAARDQSVATVPRLRQRSSSIGKDGPFVLSFYYWDQNSNNSALILNLKYTWVQQLLFSSLATPSLIVDQWGNILLANQAAEALDKTWLDHLATITPKSLSKDNTIMIDEVKWRVYSQDLDKSKLKLIHLRSENNSSFNPSFFPKLGGTIILALALLGLFLFLLLKWLIRPYANVLKTLDQTPMLKNDNRQHSAKDDIKTLLKQTEIAKTDRELLARQLRLRKLLSGLEDPVILNSFFPNHDSLLLITARSGDLELDCAYISCYFAGLNYILTPAIDNRLGEIIGQPEIFLACSTLQISTLTPDRLRQVLADLQELSKLRAFHDYVLQPTAFMNLESGLSEPSEIIPELLKCVQAGRQESALSLFQDLTVSFSKDRWPRIHLHLSQLYLAIREYLPPEENTLDLHQLAKFLDLFFTKSDLEEFFQNILIPACAYQLSKKNLKNEQLMAKVDQLIEDNYKDIKLHPGKIADNLGLSTAYLNRLYKEMTGHSLGSAINKRRLIEASIQLTETDASIESIANQCGIDNTSYFYTLFKKEFEMTPKQWRSKE